jgi:hypothetical protein
MENNDIIDMDEKTLELKQPSVLNEAEWVFQFDEDEPQIFAVTPEDRAGEPLSITLAINNDATSNIVFSNGDKKFSIYCRELTDGGREFRKSQQLPNSEETVNETKD